MKQVYKHAMSPVRIAGHLLKNRIISGPSTIHTTSNGQVYPSEYGMRFFEARARAGAGLVTCACITVGDSSDNGVTCNWDVTRPNHLNRLAEMAERIHFYGAKCTMEIIGIFPEGYTVCDGALILGGPRTGHFMPLDKMMKYKEDCVNAVMAIKKAGFDGIMIHAGHNVPFAQFLSPLTNKRSDEYGGSTEKRCRYVKEVLQAIRAAIGPDMILDLRVSGSEFEPGGINIEEGIRIAEILQEHVDIIQVSAGMHSPEWRTVAHPCGFLPPMPNVFLAETFKKSGRIKKPFISTIGAIRNLSDAESIIAEGKADFVVMVRSFIADIDVLKKGLEERDSDVTPCIRCMRCHDSDNYSHHMQCSVNPRVGMEHFLERVPPAPRAKNVAVIGGGPAGMQAALTAASRGHTVTLFEQTQSLGGIIKFADHVSFKYPLKNYKDFMIAQIEKSQVTVRLNTKASPADIEGYDAVIAAVGSVPLIPPIPGIEKAVRALEVYGNESALGKNLVVVGGGQVGCETALHLTRLGKTVTILEMRDTPAPDASPTHRDELLVEMKKEKELTVICGAVCTAIEEGKVSYLQDNITKTLNADAIILAAGMKPRRMEADAFIGLTDLYHAAGDCVRPRTVEWAVKEGFYAAMNL
ncbi:MAG: FAD-dependent oxidoreductase [Treponema sp.]|jgi:2,4-dienoyl-CoA reductase-like NADH-dependent reductase (Old Yellow Enzyme family)/thioredoxin reductase|nr:FAD-dependent oxidoreductase [Treponema sp.]